MMVLYFDKTISGLPGSFFIVKSITEALCMQKFSYQHFGLCILCPYAAHVITTGILIMYIGHRTKIRGIELQTTNEATDELILSVRPGLLQKARGKRSNYLHHCE